MYVSLGQDVGVDGDDVFKGSADPADTSAVLGRECPQDIMSTLEWSWPLVQGRPDSYFARLNLRLPEGLVCFNPRS